MKLQMGHSGRNQFHRFFVENKMRFIRLSLLLVTLFFTGLSGPLDAQVVCPKTHVFDMGTFHFYNTIQCASNGSGGCSETNGSETFGYNRELLAGELGCQVVSGACKCKSPIQPTITIEFVNNSAIVFDKDEIPQAIVYGRRGFQIRYVQTVRCQDAAGNWVYYLLMTANHFDRHTGSPHWPGVGKRFAFTLNGKPKDVGPFDSPRAKRTGDIVRFRLKDFSVVKKHSTKPKEQTEPSESGTG